MHTKTLGKRARRGIDPSTSLRRSHHPGALPIQSKQRVILFPLPPPTHPSNKINHPQNYGSATVLAVAAGEGLGAAFTVVGLGPAAMAFATAWLLMPPVLPLPLSPCIWMPPAISSGTTTALWLLPTVGRATATAGAAAAPDLEAARLAFFSWGAVWWVRDVECVDVFVVLVEKSKTNERREQGMNEEEGQKADHIQLSVQCSARFSPPVPYCPLTLPQGTNNESREWKMERVNEPDHIQLSINRSGSALQCSAVHAPPVH